MNEATRRECVLLLLESPLLSPPAPQANLALLPHPCVLILSPRPQVELDVERKRDLSKKQYNAIFYGNPGTGELPSAS